MKRDEVVKSQPHFPSLHTTAAFRTKIKKTALHDYG